MEIYSLNTEWELLCNLTFTTSVGGGRGGGQLEKTN